MPILGPKPIPDEEPAEPSKSQKFTMRWVSFTQTFSSTNKVDQAGFVHKKKGKKRGDCRPYYEDQFNGKNFNLRELKDATENFSSANKIGEGGFGSVYKGVLPDKTAIAVKKLSMESKQGNLEFQNEVYALSTLKHPNLVKLLGRCREKNQCLLVYEYMTNGSLDNVLFGSGWNLKRRLDWTSRVKICLGIAKGLSYLHDDRSKAKIVHRDFKLSNILLDKYFNPKISDFGLAKYCAEEENVSTIVGTWGYMAPEYAMHGLISEKTDVYSFGIVTLEIFSGKRITSSSSSNESILELAISSLKKGALIALIDADLTTSFSVKEVTKVLYLAMLCIVDSPTLRPTMSEVVNILEGKTMTKTLLPPLEQYYSLNMTRTNSERTTTDISVNHLRNTLTETESNPTRKCLGAHENGGADLSSKEENNAATAFHGDLVSDVKESKGEGREVKVLIQPNLATTWEPPIRTARFSTFSASVDATKMEDKGELQYVEPSFEGGKHHIKCLDDEFEAACNEWKDSLVGYFLDERPFNVNQETIEELWEVKGNVSVFSIGNEYFLFQFNCIEDRIRVLESSDLWHIDQRPLVLIKWDWRLKFNKTEMKSLPVWVKIYNLPLFLWTSSFLSQVGSGLGIPLYVDQKTRNRYKLDYAKLCIEVDASKPLPECWYISVKGIDYQLKLEYDWRPLRCANCCTFGHIESECRLKMKKSKQN